MKVFIYFVFISIFSLININAQETILNKKRKLNPLIEFLSIPNNSDNKIDIDKNIYWLKKQFMDIGFKHSIIKEGDIKYFFAEKHVSDNLPTVLLYMHFDGQPTDSKKWSQKDPYKPVFKLKENELSNDNIPLDEAIRKSENNDVRIYARSSSDDKGPIVMLLIAITEMVKEKLPFKFNIKVILDSEEEKGSPNILGMVKNQKELLQSDYFVVFDGPMHDSGNPTLLYGVRGVTTLTMEVYGIEKPQHSGHYGNYGPNPIFRSAELLSSLKDADGKVIIPGYYEGIVIDDHLKLFLNSVPDNELILKRRAGFNKPEKVGNTYQEAMQYPSLNVRGIQSGWVGKQARTIVPDKAVIEFDIRTVPESHPDTLVSKLKLYLKKLGYTLLSKKATKEDLLTIEKPIYIKYNNWMFPFRTKVNSRIGAWLRKAIKKEGRNTVQIRISGGSVPLSFFINELDVPTVLVPLVNPDNNQHSPNENLKLSNYFDGIETIKSILTTAIE